MQSNYGKETNRIYRETFGLTHRGAWDNGVSTTNYVQFERTRNTRLNEGLAGGTEGIFDTKTPASAPPSWTTSGAQRSQRAVRTGRRPDRHAGH